MKQHFPFVMRIDANWCGVVKDGIKVTHIPTKGWYGFLFGSWKKLRKRPDYATPNRGFEQVGMSEK